MTVRVVRTEDPMEEAVALKLVPPEPQAAPEPPAGLPGPSAPSLAIAALEPPESVSLQQRQSVVLQAVAVLTALAEVVSVRLVLILALCMSAALSAFGEHTILSLINAGVFDILVVVPIVALAVRKG